MLPAGRVVSAAVGPPVPAAIFGRALRQSLPQTLVDALDRISDQIAVDVFDPVLGADSVEQSARIFEQVFPKFRDYYVSTLFILWGFFQEDQQRFSALTMRSFAESESLIRASGPGWIGQDATLNALHGLGTVSRAAKAAIHVFDQTETGKVYVDASSGEPSANAIVGFAMAFSAVLAALAALASGRKTSARLENVAALAHWSKRYAVQTYHFTKSLGLVKPRRPIAPIGSSEQEDEFLAECGLDSYVEALTEDDQP
jgi:hypothetical protein